jgi:hypothetical protein
LKGVSRIGRSADLMPPLRMMNAGPLGSDLDTSQDATDTYDVAAGTNHYGAIGRSVVARKLGG